MLGHYLKSAVTNLRRERQFGVINIFGLSIALTAAILILLFIRDELSFDNWGPETPNLYRLEASLEMQPGTMEFVAVVSGRLRDPIANSFPSDIAAMSRLYRESHLLAQGNETFIEMVSYVDADFFDIFDVPVVSGSREAVFADNTSILISQAMAQKYFGDSNPVGQILNPDDQDFSFRVVGVFEDLPDNTHLEFDFLAYFDPERYIDRPWIATHWQSHNLYTYLKLAPESDPVALAGAFPGFLDRNVVAEEAPGLVGPLSESLQLRLMPVSDIHLKSLGRFQIKPGGDMRLVVSFGIIAALIVFIACVNFINLATARAAARSKEIALRKVVGARRKQLIQQFLLETSLIVGLALLIAMTLVEIILPYFNAFIAKFLALDLVSDPVAIAMMAGLLLVVALGAGLQPAIQITRVRPASVLHSSGSAKYQASRVRAALVTFQFAISIDLMVVTFVVTSQTEYARSKDLGFNITDKLTLEFMNYQDVAPIAQAMRRQIENQPSVEATSFTARSLPITGQWGFAFQKNGDPSNTSYHLEDVLIEHDTLNFIDAELIAGRMFDQARSLDKQHNAVGEDGIIELPSILSRYAVQYMGYASPEAAIGESFSYNELGDTYRVTIIGVVEDMNIRSLRDGLEPLRFFVPQEVDDTINTFPTLNIQAEEGKLVEAQRAVEQVWKQMVPNFPIHISSYEERYGQLYEADRQRGEIFGVFSMFAIFVSAIGLFSQAAFSAQQRSKEISLRKLMGASTFEVVRLMLWQFSKPVLVANLIAWPVAWFIASEWLAGFAFQGLDQGRFLAANVRARAPA